MDTPGYALGPDYQVSWKADGTQQTADPAQENATAVCDGTNNIPDHEIQDKEALLSQTTEPAARVGSARGAITGVVLGIGFWAIILVLVGVIKL
jgi:hypothetical protein